MSLSLFAIAFLAGAAALTFITPLPTLKFACGLLSTVFLFACILVVIKRLCIQYRSVKVSPKKPLSNSLLTQITTSLFEKLRTGICLLSVFLLGLTWTLLFAQHELQQSLPSALIRKNILISGMISSIPEVQHRIAKFEFDIQQNNNPYNTSLDTNLTKGNNTSKNLGHNSNMQVSNNITIPFPALHGLHVQLSWRNPPSNLRVGDSGCLLVQLKSPRGFWDPGVFDYQAWLFTHGIRAIGYVLNPPNNQGPVTNNYYSNNKVSNNNFIPNCKLAYYDFNNVIIYKHPIDRLRQFIFQQICTALQGQPLAGLITALAVGVRSNIAETQWATLRGTGTNHLFAIAGLHIGLVSGIIYTLVGFVWRRSTRLPLLLATPNAAALGALLTAFSYSALAGFSLPTQRAMMMIAVFLVASLWRKKLSTWHAWSIALLLSLIMNPLAILATSFWLSFGAVAFIIYGVSGRHAQTSHWRHWLRTQWVVATGLIPFSLLLFHQASLAGLLANAIAIPWVGFITLPLSLLGSIALLISTKLSTDLWLAAEYSLACIWPLLTHIANWQWAQWFNYVSNELIFLCALIAVLLLLAPRGFIARWLAILWLLPLLLWLPRGPRAGEVWLTVLDVGQGLAVVVRTQQHTLVYDTGPKFSATFDAGNAVVVPFLQGAGINHLDSLVITDLANPHFGGTESVFAQFPVTQILTSVPTLFNPAQTVTCRAGQQWRWDGVDFQLLDTNCLLQIRLGSNNLLLTSELTRKTLHALVSAADSGKTDLKENNDQEKNISEKNPTLPNTLTTKQNIITPNFLLPLSVLVAPHYGSDSANPAAFIQATRPRYVLFSAGMQNRYDYPSPAVIARYRAVGAIPYNTAEQGAITLRVTATHLSRPDIYPRHFWDF